MNTHTDLPACELFLVFPLVKLSEAPPPLQVKGGVGPAAVTSLPGFETHREEVEKFKTGHQAPRRHSVPRHLFSRCPEASSFLMFLPWKGENNLCHEPESMNPGMCYFINTPLSHCSHYPTQAARGKKREGVLTIGGLCDIDPRVWECVDSSSQHKLTQQRGHRVLS